MSEEEIDLTGLDQEIDELLVAHFFMEDQVIDELRYVILEIITLLDIRVEVRV